VQQYGWKYAAAAVRRACCDGERATVQILILADDLTGAADSAARCHHMGWPATICLEPPGPDLPEGVVALTSDSRHLPVVTAAHHVRKIVSGLSKVEEGVWYKKIDSTLRGNIGGELDAMLDVLGRRYAMVAPAFPAQNRGLKHGYLISKLGPIDPPHLPTLLGQQSRRAITVLPLSDVREGSQHLAAQLAAVQQHETQLIVADGVTDDDLRTILAATQAALPDALLCGSAGLITMLAVQQPAAVGRHSGKTMPSVERVGSGPALLVVGSGSAVARAQIEYVRRRNEIAVVELGSDRQAPQDRDVLLHLPQPVPGTCLDGSAARALAARLAETATLLMIQRRPSVLVLAGGNTAIAVLSRLGTPQLRVVRELLPGMPLIRGVDKGGQAYLMILKAGNHGDEAALHTLLQRARCEG
jgi:uncharacterized protein YgbK (DUF1537 family)